MTKKTTRTPEQEIASAIYERLRDRHGVKMEVFAAVVRQVRNLLAEVKDPNEVELVCLALADRDQENFSAFYSLNWGSYEYFRHELDIPDGAWKWALWAYKLEPGPVQQSADYWLALWKDDPTQAPRVQRMLQQLEIMGLDLEEVTW